MVDEEAKSSSSVVAENDTDETQSFLHTDYVGRIRKPRLSHPVLGNWILGSLSLVLMAVVLVQQRRLNNHSIHPGSSYESGFTTDFIPVKEVIAVEEVSFTGGLLYDENGTLYREVDSTQPQYVGLPGPHIDKAWADLMSALEVVIEGQEAEVSHLRGHTIEEPDGKSFRLSLDVYHSLHCVNLVRQALDVDYYHRNGEGARVYRIHTDHCLDYLRQTIQCAGDLTPLYYQYSEIRKRGFPVWGAKHTCRNFGKIHEWAMSRHRDQPGGEPSHGGHH